MAEVVCVLLRVAVGVVDVLLCPAVAVGAEVCVLLCPAVAVGAVCVLHPVVAVVDVRMVINSFVPYSFAKPLFHIIFEYILRLYAVSDNFSSQAVDTVKFSFVTDMIYKTNIYTFVIKLRTAIIRHPCFNQYLIRTDSRFYSDVCNSTIGFPRNIYDRNINTE